MESTQPTLNCDGCGLPASPSHIAERVRRLERSTKYRPIHINVLFVALAPPAIFDNDFYAPPSSKEFFDPFLDALDIPSFSDRPEQPLERGGRDNARLAEFQHRGYYLACVSECPRLDQEEPAAATIARLGPTLVRRIRFNYRPKYVAPLGLDLNPLVSTLTGAGIGQILILHHGAALPVPRTGDRDWLKLFHGAVAIAASSGNL